MDTSFADAFTVGILPVLAQDEREMIAERAWASLAAAKASGVTLGGCGDNLASVSDLGRAPGKGRLVRRLEREGAWLNHSASLIIGIATERNQRGSPQT